MKSPIENIKTICEQSAEALTGVVKNIDAISKSHLQWNFTAKDIVWKKGEFECDIRKSHKENPFYEGLFKQIGDLGLKKLPVLYYFTIESKFDYTLLTEHYNQKLTNLGNLKKGNGKRHLSSFRARTDCENWLYCGKVVKDIDLRMVVHMGYEKNGLTWGLQLYRWLPEKFPDLKIQLNAFGFAPQMAPLMGALEYQMAKVYKPIIGKHS